jgi:gamma-glutamyltranspeptidase/glutathione hydrolase
MKTATKITRLVTILCAAAIMVGTMQAAEGRTQKPALHAQHWMAVTGKPLAATA